MKKHLLSLLLVLAGVLAGNAASTMIHNVRFGSDYNQSKVGSYAASFEVVENGNYWNVTNFNNNNNGWAYVACFAKSSSNVSAYIDSKFSMPELITEVVVNGRQHSKSSGKITGSIVVEYADNADFTNATECGRADLSAWTTSDSDYAITVSGAPAGSYCRVAFYGSNSSSQNGGVIVNSVQVYGEEQSGPDVPTLETFEYEGFRDYILNPGDLVEWSLGSMDKPAIVFASSDEDVAMADESGILAGIAGTAEITATWAADDRFAEGSATFKVEVKDADAPVLINYEPAFAGKDLEVNLADGQYQLDRGERYPAEIIFVSENEDVASVDDKGLITLNAAGTTTISCVWMADDTFKEGETSFLLTVKATETPVDPSDKVTVVLTEETFALSGNSYVAYSYTDDYGVTYQMVAAKNGGIAFNTKNSNGKASGLVISANKNNRVVESVSVDFAAANNGLKIYAANKVYPELVAGTAPDFGEEEPVATAITDATAVEIGKTGFAIVPVSTGMIQINSITITYAAEGGDVPTPEKTTVALAWSEETAVATLGKAFEAPALSVSPKAAAAAVSYKTSNEEIATVNELGEVTPLAVGEAVITAFIPEDNEEYVAAEASYTLTVKEATAPVDPVGNERAIVLAHSQANYTGDIANVVVTDGMEDTVEGVLSFAFSGANGSEYRVYANQDIVFTPAEGVTLTKIVFTDTNSKSPTITADKGECSTVNRVTTWTGAATEAVTINTTAQIRINYFEIYYTVAETEETYEVSDVRVAATVETEAVAETINGVAVTEAAAFRLTASAATTAPAVAFEYEGKAWTVAAEDGKVSFTADYVPAPASGSVLSYYGCSLEGEALTEVAQMPVACDAKPSDKFSLILDGHKFKSTVNEENTKVMLDIKLAHSLVHHNAANAELPYFIDYKLTSANHTELEVSYDLATDTATIKNFIVIDIDPAFTIDDIALMLEKFEFLEEHSLEAEPQILFPVLVAAEPAVVAGMPARRAAFEAARPELTVVSGAPAKADDAEPFIALPYNLMVMNDDVATGIESVAVDALNAPAEYFNLQGIRVFNPAKGQVVIRRQANGHVDKLRF